jgi:hypothetical protein
MDDQVGESDRRCVAAGVGSVVALDGTRDRVRDAPAADQHRPDDRMIDPELAALAPRVVVGRLTGQGQLVVLAVEVGEYEAADVVKQRRDRELLALRQPGMLGDRLGGVADRDRVAAEALVALRFERRPGEQLVGVELVGELAQLIRLQRLDRIADRGRTAGQSGAVVGGPHHRDRKRSVGLDRFGELAHRRRGALAGGEKAPARLGECGHPRDGLERRGQPLAAGGGPGDGLAALPPGRRPISRFAHVQISTFPRGSPTRSPT